DRESHADEVIEGHASCHQIAASLGGRERDLIFAGQAFERFHFNQRDLAVRAVLVREGSFLEKIAVADEAAAGDRLDFVRGLQVFAFAVRDEDAGELAVEHGSGNPDLVVTESAKSAILFQGPLNTASTSTPNPDNSRDAARCPPLKTP